MRLPLRAARTLAVALATFGHDGCAADAGGRQAVRRLRRRAHGSARGLHRRSEPDAPEEELPERTRLEVELRTAGDQYDEAWRWAGKASRGRSAASGARAAAAAAKAEAAAEQAESFAPAADAPSPGEAERQAQAALSAAMSWQQKAKGLLGNVEQRAYAAAHAAAEARVQRLKQQAAQYYAKLMADFNALAEPRVDKRQEAIAAATQPYWDARAKLEGMAVYYNKQAVDGVAEASALAGSARALATKAVYEQAEGQAFAAQRDMMQAHAQIKESGRKRKLANDVKRLAESVNSAIPSYEQAADMAFTHADAEFLRRQQEDAD